MRIAVTYGPLCLQRSAEETWNDPRTGSEVGWRRIVEELRKLGHEVETAPLGSYDVAISINEPDTLRDFSGPNETAGRKWWVHAPLRICCFWLNEFSFCKEGFDDHVDVYLSPSEAHRQKAIGDWGAPKPEKWHVNHLGCDPGRLLEPELAQGAGSDSRSGAQHGGGAVGLGKIPGRVVYCSSPDRGLHRVLEAWPQLRRAVPHATLKVFYRLSEWFRSFDQTPYFPPIEKLRHRALWCEEALKRLSGPEYGIEVLDSVSHDEVLRQMAMAECVAFPCHTVSWSEGFSCATMEACMAEACPVVTDCDALGEVYSDLDPLPVGDWVGWRDRVIKVLTEPDVRAHYNKKARALAERNTWKIHAEKLNATICEKLGR